MKVNVVWYTEDGDKLVAYMARVSNPENQHKDETASRLISYLIKHKHWSPFEMVNMCVEIRTTRDIGRQLLRHRSFSFQEFSQRYAQPFYDDEFRQVRLQDAKNRQNSIITDNEELQEWWYEKQLTVRQCTYGVYEEALAKGVAKEVARAVLPEGLTTTTLYMNGNLRSWLHFAELRTKPDTQLETRRLALEIKSIIATYFPSISAAVGMHLEEHDTL